MSTKGQRIIEGLKQAVAGDFARVTVEGQTWVREDMSGWQPSQTLYGRVLNQDLEFRGIRKLGSEFAITHWRPYSRPAQSPDIENDADENSSS